jgi:MFS family permease
MPPDSHAGTLFRHRNFVLLWGGQAISLIGNGIFVVALPLTVLHLTSSPLALALVVSGQVIATVVLLLVGGAVVDRLPRRFLMLTADAVCGISVSLVAVLVVSGVARLWELFVLTLIFGAAGAFFKPAATAIVRDILPADLLVPASSLRSVSQSLSGLVIGPLTGGLIVATAGAGWAFGIDGASFAVSAACLASMRNVPRVKATSTRILEGVAEGLRYCYSQRWLACSIVALGIGNLVIFYPFFILVPLLVKNVFHGGAFALGIFFAANGAGSLVASLATARRGMPSRPVMTIWTTCAAAGACLALVGASPWFWVSVFFTGLGLGLVSYANILWFPLVQHETPAELLGRVSSIDWLFSLAFSPLGALAAAAAAATFGVRAALIAGGMIAVATGSVLFVPGVRAPDKRNEATVQAATRSLQADETVLEAFS